MRKALPILLLSLAACSADQTAKVQTTAARVEATAARVEPGLARACNVAMTLAPAAGAAAPWIIGGCGTADGLAKLAADPSSLAWVNGLIAQVRR